MKIEAIDFFYLSMPVVTDAGDGSQDALLVRVVAGGVTGWGECEASPLTSIAAYVTPMSHGACRPVRDVVLGKPLNGAKDIAALASCDNVICKISGVIASAPQGISPAESLAPIVNHCLDEFGPDRVVFGGDWPVCLLGGTFREWVTALRTIISQRPQADQEKLWSGNARRHYSLT